MRAPVERVKATWSCAAIVVDAQRSGHAKVHYEDVGIIEVGEKIFRSSAERDDLAAGQTLGKPVRKRKPEVWPPLVNSEDPRVDHRRLKPAPHRFHFGQFRHVSSLVAGDRGLGFACKAAGPHRDLITPRQKNQMALIGNLCNAEDSGAGAATRVGSCVKSIKSME